jgi:guanylate kinase
MSDLAPSISRRGLLLVLSSPGGVGKTTISRRLIERDPSIALSVSATTRPMREGEIDGIDYHFVSGERFNEMLQKDELLEHTNLTHGRYYGTPRAPVEEALAAGRDVLFVLDWVGVKQLARTMRDDLVSIFILAPSIAEQAKRLRSRGKDSEEAILRRLSQGREEMTHWDNYDYVIVNEHVETSVSKVQTILSAERTRRTRQTGLAAFIEGLCSEKV